VQEFCTKKEQLILRDFVVNASIPDEDEWKDFHISWSSRLEQIMWSLPMQSSWCIEILANCSTDSGVALDFVDKWADDLALKRFTLDHLAFKKADFGVPVEIGFDLSQKCAFEWICCGWEWGFLF
jgi:hypothetical protein